MKFKTLSDFVVQGKKVVVRADLNVPLFQGQITDNSRILAVLPTLQELLEKGASVILISHLGRPKNREAEFSLRPVAEEIKQLLSPSSFYFAETLEEAQLHSTRLKPGYVMMMENLRFYAEEEENDKAFSQKLAQLGDIYVNDGFSVSHRAHASVEGITHFLPSCAGRLLESELTHLEKFLTHPRPPVVAILGGSKISTKLGLIKNLLPKVNTLLIGGGMAGTLLSAQGISVGASLQEPQMKDEALSLLRLAQQKKCEIVLSTDVMVATHPDTVEGKRLCSVHDIADHEMIMDVGPETIALFQQKLKNAKTVVWNGPLGRVEVPSFAQGTESVAQFLAQQKDMITVSGGGDTVAILNKLGLVERFSYVSLSGGAFLEWLEGKVLPGLVALENA
ncbi:MAG: phosphoglycerate kinase [Alphaproteobacteria bacterium]